MTRRASLATAACAALLAAGCGGGGGGSSSFTGPDPASVTPAGAPVFAEAVVRPQGGQKAALDAALSKLLARDDPGSFIVDRIDRALAGEAKGFTYESDVAPWLGPRAGIFFQTFTARARGAAVLSVTDAAAARQAIAKASSGSGKRERKATYRGVGYRLSGDGTATGLVGDLVVTGSRQAFEDAVDASRGSSLAESSDFKQQLDSEPDDQVAFAYADPRGIASALVGSGQLTERQLSFLGNSTLRPLLQQPVAVSVSATSDQLSLQASAAASGSTPSLQESSLLRDFPADSWLAFAATDAGQGLEQSLGATGKALGFDLGSELGQWAGDVGGFVRGTSLFGLGGALVLESRDEQASARTLDDLQHALSRDRSVQVEPLSAPGEHGFSLSPAGVPIELQFVQHGGEVVAGVGSDSVDQVLSPSSTLGDSDAFKAATDALGSDFSPVAFLDFVPLGQLLDSFPQVRDDPDYRQATPYLDHLDFLAVGGRDEGDRRSVRIVLGLRDAPAAAGQTAAANAPAATVP